MLSPSHPLSLSKKKKIGLRNSIAAGRATVALRPFFLWVFRGGRVLCNIEIIDLQKMAMWMIKGCSLIVVLERKGLFGCIDALVLIGGGRCDPFSFIRSPANVTQPWGTNSLQESRPLYIFWI